MFHTGAGTGKLPPSCEDNDDGGGVQGAVDGYVHCAEGPAGPWQPFPALNISNLQCDDPSPMLHSNGTVYVVCNEGPNFAIYRTDIVTAASSADWRLVTKIEFPPSWGGPGSDASLYLHVEVACQMH